MSRGTALITGASSGIGAVYADRLARCGHDLILVARTRESLDNIASRIRRDTGRSIRVIAADLNQSADLALVEQVLRELKSIVMLVNSAGIGDLAPAAECDITKVEYMIDLNIRAILHLTHAVGPAMVNRRTGVIVNIGSVAAIAPELLNCVYGGSKAFVLAFSVALHNELSRNGIRVRAVLPGATATHFWAIAGTRLQQLPSEIVMTAEDLVDAALQGFEQGEVVTIPSLPDIADWCAYEAARQAMIPLLSLSSPAPRYAITR